MEYVLDAFKRLAAIDSPSGFTSAAADLLEMELASFGFAPARTNKGCVLCCIGGEGQENGLLLSAHVDTLGGMIAEIKANGRLKLTRIGGLQPNNIEAENCVIRTRAGQAFTGTMQLNEPSSHVNNKYGEEKRDFDGMEVVIDEPVQKKEDTEALGISVGDYVCFDPRTVVTPTGYIKSRFIDDKLSAAILLGLARDVSRGTLTPKRKTYLYFTVYEEVGHGCSASVPAGVSEILCVDMGCVGGGLGCDERKVSICAKDSAGPYNYEMTTRLVSLAKENGLDYAVDVYPFYGSDADAALSAGSDVRHALIGPGVYASHGYERSHRDGAENAKKLAALYLSR